MFGAVKLTRFIYHFFQSFVATNQYGGYNIALKCADYNDVVGFDDGIAAVGFE
jgi:hypothetical protein